MIIELVIAMGDKKISTKLPQSTAIWRVLSSLKSDFLQRSSTHSAGSLFNVIELYNRKQLRHAES